MGSRGTASTTAGVRAAPGASTPPPTPNPPGPSSTPFLPAFKDEFPEVGSEEFKRQRSEAQRWSRDAKYNMTKNLTQAEEASLADYKGIEFKTINGGLVSGKPLTPFVEDRVSNIDSALRKSYKNNGEMIVVRDIRTTQIGGKGLLAKLESGEVGPGHLMEHAGYSSTTASDGHKRGTNIVRMYIQLPARTPTLPLGANDSVTQNMFGIKGESEILLGRGARTRIHRVEKKDGVYNLYMKYEGAHA